MTNPPITTAMLFAAGFGERMRPLTNDKPKPLIPINGKTILDHNLDHLAQDGITQVVINTHYKAEQIHGHVKNRTSPTITISHEKEQILETAGGIIYALPHLGNNPFFVINGDIIWIDHKTSALARMAEFFDEKKMDILMLLHPKDKAIGYDGKGDFHYHPDTHTITRPTDNSGADYIFTGIQIIHPRVFEGLECKPFSLRKIYFNQTTTRIHALIHEGDWLHIGTPKGVGLAEKYLY